MSADSNGGSIPNTCDECARWNVGPCPHTGSKSPEYEAIAKWLPREEESTARCKLRELIADRDEGWRQHNQAEIGRLNAEARLQRAIATLEYMGGAEAVVDDLRHGALPEPSDSSRLS